MIPLSLLVWKIFFGRNVTVFSKIITAVRIRQSRLYSAFCYGVESQLCVCADFGIQYNIVPKR